MNIERKSSIVAVLLVTVLALPTKAQSTLETEEQEPSSVEDAGEQAAESPSPDETKSSDDLAAIKQQLADQQREIEEQKARLAELEETVEEQQLASLEEEMEESSHERLFSTYGFFDVTFIKTFLEEGNTSHVGLFDTSSFIISKLNVYLDSQMTEDLRALAELQFNFMPHGYEREHGGIVNGVAIPGREYDRQDNTVRTYADAETVTFGGVAIERAFFEYSPRDWLYFKAGRYLTPYGIWNVDHGTTVVLTARVPYMQLRQLVPRAQTGIQVGGRVFPSGRTFFDYAFTLSNGRGPMDMVWDLDENKAVGLRLKWSYEREDMAFSLGAYGYYGKYTDVTKTIELRPSHSDNLLWIEVLPTRQYDEYLGTADLRLKLFGVLLQSESALRYIHNTRLNQLTETEGAFMEPEPGYVGPHYMADYLARDIYVLLAYELPLEKLLGEIKITPYGVFEYSFVDPYIDIFNVYLMYGGVNIRPSPYLCLKFEYSYVYYVEQEKYGDPPMNITAQAAVFF